MAKPSPVTARMTAAAMVELRPDQSTAAAMSFCRPLRRQALTSANETAEPSARTLPKRPSKARLLRTITTTPAAARSMAYQVRDSTDSPSQARARRAVMKGAMPLMKSALATVT